MKTPRKALSAAMVVAAVTASVTMSPPASAAAVTIRIQYDYTTVVREMVGLAVCPTNQVLLSRSHRGDENGYTTYHCGWIFINDEQVQVHTANVWTPSQGLKESKSDFVAPPDQALVGRWHTGDENGLTKYETATLTWRGQPVRLINPVWSSWYKESKHASQAGYNQVMTGRTHNGDENGSTRYQYATVAFYES
ncbi:hypothetical protein GCM10010517_44830 [Streptosporangium fragile]|uniref:Uncharacterized protein n=1 Tax=Streptosporangium fragile TaxID=46186 RepID=A0ABN3W1D3_9ACTN